LRRFREMTWCLGERQIEDVDVDPVAGLREEGLDLLGEEEVLEVRWRSWNSSPPSIVSWSVNVTKSIPRDFARR